MSIFYLDEHIECPNYVSDIRVGFKYVKVPKGSIFEVVNKPDKHLLFFLEGSSKIRYNEFPDKVFQAGEMIFLPKSADCRGEAITDLAFMMLIYDNPVKLCDKIWLNSLVQYSQKINYEFKGLKIRKELMWFLEQLQRYLHDGLSCRHLHEIKQKELFLVFRVYYAKEDLAQFFFPMLGKSMDFRSKVMAYYLSVKTAKELAESCGYSERRFSDIFIAEFGLPPYQWMQKQKAKHVIGRLSQLEVPLKEIADEFGFASASHFNKYCIKYYGETPSQVRAKLSIENQ